MTSIRPKGEFHLMTFTNCQHFFKIDGHDFDFSIDLAEKGFRMSWCVKNYKLRNLVGKSFKRVNGVRGRI